LGEEGPSTEIQLIHLPPWGAIMTEKDYLEEISRICIEYDLELRTRNVTFNENEYALCTISDPSVGIFLAQVSPWFPSLRELYNWHTLIQEIYQQGGSQ